jgi:hypothetical protein
MILDERSIFLDCGRSAGRFASNNTLPFSHLNMIDDARVVLCLIHP